MKELQIFNFEENKVEIIEINGEPHFEIYSTGAALGYFVTNTVGHKYPRKERIETTVKNAEITPCFHGGNKYFSESQLYDFMLEAKTEKCKPFRKWLTREVLASIRPGGKYATPATAKELLENPDFLIEALTELKAIRAKNSELEVKLNELEKFWTIKKFNQHFNLSWDMKTCQGKEKAASAYSRQHGYEIQKCQTNDDRFDSTNSYAYEVLERLFLPKTAVL